MRFRFIEFVLAVAALGAVVYGARYMVGEGLEVVVASQPPRQTYADTPIIDWNGCNVGLTTSRPSAASKPCRFEPTPYSAPQAFPIQTMSEADSKKAGLWLASAGLLPLAVGAVAALVLLVIPMIVRSLAANAASRREFAALERLAEAKPERDPLNWKRL